MLRSMHNEGLLYGNGSQAVHTCFYGYEGGVVHLYIKVMTTILYFPTVNSPSL